MQTSDKGIAFLERHEGVVLKAYRDPVGIWTIGAGLTAASGVVKPSAGMTITADEASALTRKALTANYEPAVEAAMPGAEQHEFDAGVSFHWNTGAIGRASWVRAWRIKAWEKVQAKLALWSKAKGRVLAGLKRRRDEEFKLLRFGIYEGAIGYSPPKGLARFVVPVDPETMAELRRQFTKLGYEPGASERGIFRTAVKAFQEDHDLTVDGVMGKATLSTLQRMTDARTKGALAGGATAAAAPGTQATELTGDLANLPWLDWFGWAALAACLIWLLWTAFHYRDALAARIAFVAPKTARFLRSF